MKVEKITPEIAKDLLEKNTSNRKVKEHHIRSLSEQMKKGQWQLNGETIIISKDGTILDGQHRLMSVVKSGESINSYVVYGVDDNAKNTIDTGVSRGPADILAINGYQNSTLLAKVVRNVILFRSKMFSTLEYSRGQKVSSQDILNFLIVEPQIANCFSFPTKTGGKTFNIISRADLAFYWYIFKDINEFLATTFVNNIVHGAPEIECVTNQLRNRLIQDKLSKFAKLPSHIKTKMVFKAWDRFYKNIKVKNFSLKADEEFIYPIHYPKYE